VLGYHERSKHRPGRYAPSLGYLDWETQPAPFRTWEGAPRLLLPFAADAVATSWADLLTAGAVPPAAPSLASLGAFFELALGLTAWKRAGAARWSLRANPSSGNLHPTEGWLVVPRGDALPPGVHHYLPRDHLLEQRVAFAPATVARARDHAAARRGGFGVALTSIHWREAWKYGERAFRYCQHDLGHALASLRLAAAALGWRATWVDEAGDARLARLIGLDRDADFAHLAAHDREQPETLLWIEVDGGAVDGTAVAELVAALARDAGDARFSGRANVLSPDHVDWPVIELAAQATIRPAGERDERDEREASVAAPPDPLRSAALPRVGGAARAATLIRQRRSAVAFDPRPTLAKEAFFALLDSVLPRAAPPWDAWPAAPLVHLLLFVHRVDGVAPGLYLLARRAAAVAELRAAIRAPFAWTPVEPPAPTRLWLLKPGDWRDTAQLMSCGQQIAADGAFTVAMLARFEAEVARAPWRYRRLFWESGFVGQQLYLEAEAQGVRATGIGCYFDDVVHELLGFGDRAFQSLYHFTVGTPVDDARIVAEPAYGEELRARQA